jgi:hypothetical protein
MVSASFCARFAGWLSRALAFCTAWLICASAHAWVLQIPKGAEFATLPQGRVLCGPIPEGFSMDAARRRVRPKDDAPVGHSLNIVLGQSELACNGAAVEEATLIVTGDHPSIDASSVTVALDAGRLEFRGERLEGVNVGYTSDDKTGTDVCLNVTRDRDREFCALNIDRSLPADPQHIELHWAPPGGRVGRDAIIFDKHGDPLTADQTRIVVARLLITRAFPDTRMVDVAHGEGRVMLVHPEAVSSAECGTARCEATPDGLIIYSVSAAAPRLAVRLQLRPHVFLARGDVLDNVVGETLTVLRCPLSMVSGEPPRGVDELNVLVRLDPACVVDVQRLVWTANADPSEVIRVESLPDGVYVLLWIGRLSSERLTIVASRRDDGSVLAVASEKTIAFPPVMASLTLPGFGQIEFIPRNRPALVSVTPIGGKGELVPISVPGAYSVTRTEQGYLVRSVYASGGYAALRFAYRTSGVPEQFTDTDLGVVTDPVQRPIREASIPAPIGATSVTDHAIIELFCKNTEGKIALIPPGTTVHIPYKERNSCRLVLHRERIAEEDGEQRLDVDVSVAAVGGVDRPEAHWTQHLSLVHSKERDVVWIRGAKEQFDRITVHITHIIDESLYGGDAHRHLELPTSQWSVVTENANFKFYATAAIPASLYRFSRDRQDLGTGPLSLNFGVLSRLTWLDSEGREGLVAIEAGMMGMGLATDADRQLALVTGLGIAIPLSNANSATQAAVNIHAWLAYTVGPIYGKLLDDAGMVIDPHYRLNNWAFVFGPSITVGGLGALL